ncbi:hypothetical protein V8D89_001068 [Ganoderma adspersum]
MSTAERGHVADPEMFAYSGELVAQARATIRFGLPHEELTEYTARQHNLQRFERPIMRRHLAIAIAEELRRVLAALEESGWPLTLPNGRRVAFEDIYLIDIKRVSRGSLQPTLAVRGA